MRRYGNEHRGPAELRRIGGTEAAQGRFDFPLGGLLGGLGRFGLIARCGRGARNAPGPLALLPRMGAERRQAAWR